MADSTVRRGASSLAGSILHLAAVYLDTRLHQTSLPRHCYPLLPHLHLPKHHHHHHHQDHHYHHHHHQDPGLGGRAVSGAKKRLIPCQWNPLHSLCHRIESPLCTTPIFLIAYYSLLVGDCIHNCNRVVIVIVFVLAS